jgi:CSLREA domain-containing protein
MLALGLVSSAHAAEFVVSRQDDPAPDGCQLGDCSLREAIIAANATADADVITLSNVTYTLSIPGVAEQEAATGDLDVSQPLTINGQGAGATIVEAGASTATGIDRVFDVRGGSLTLNGLTVRHGNAGPAGAGGISVIAGASLTVASSTITLNTAGANGGGISNSGSLTMTDSTVSSNSTPGGGTVDKLGGGIATFSTGTMALTNVTISGNSTGRQGGGIYHGGTGSTITGGSITGNSTPLGTTNDRDGGGLYNSSGASLTLTNVAVTNNVSGRDGGGILNNGTLTINGGSITGNSILPDPTDPDPNNRNGGGVRHFTGSTTTITNTTISSNSAVRSGGGIAGSGNLQLTNATVTLNQAGTNGGGVNGFSGIVNGVQSTLIISGGTVSQNTAGSTGGGIIGSSTTEVTGTTVSNNQAGTVTVSSGGGVASFASSTAGVTTRLTLTNVMVSGNSASGSGGGMSGSGSLRVTNSTITGNQAGTSGTGSGGGISASVALVTGVTTLLELTDVTVTSNTATGSSGGGISAFGANLNVTGGTIQNNSATFDGGGIAKGTGTNGAFSHTSQATIRNALIKDNHGTTASSDGGGVANAAGPLEIRDSIIEDNDALGFGGGLGNFNGGVTTIFDSSIRNNQAGLAGGGITQSNQASTSITLTDSTVSGNVAQNGSGGGLIVGSNSGSVTLVRSTFSGNAGTNSAGLSIGSGSALTATNSTLSGNIASQTGGGIGTFGTVALTNVTLQGNQAAQAGAVNVLAGTFSTRNSIFANSTGGNCSGTVTSQGNNLEFPGNSCGLNAGIGDLPNTDPQLGPLTNNGGVTLTHAVNGNSPAVDGGTNTGCPSTDQRGTARPNDGNGDGTNTCDIGAVEATVFALTVNKTGSGASTGTVAGSGINCGPVCQRTYAAGRNVSLTAANTGAVFMGWSGACTGTGACQPAMDGAKTVTADFQRLNVGVSVTGPQPQPQPPFLTSTLSARPGCGFVVQIQFGVTGQPFANAVVTVTSPSGGPGPTSTGFLYVPPPSTPSVTIMIQRAVQTGGATVTPILFKDGCGDWTTLVGGGASAFQ